MAESVYATPPSPDLSDEDMAIHHPVVILEEHNTGANEAGDDQALATPTSGNGAVRPASPVANSHAAAISSAEEAAVSDHGPVELPHSAAASTAFPSYPHQSQPQQPDDQPTENGASPATTSKDQSKSPEPTANLFSDPAGNNQYALPFADFAAHLLKASNGGQMPHLPPFDPISSSKVKKGRKQTAPNRLSDDTVLNPAAAAAAAAMNLSQFQASSEDDSAEAAARRQFLAEFTQKLAAIVEQQDGGAREQSGDDEGSAGEDEDNSDTASLENGELEKMGNSHQPRHYDVSGDFQCTMCPAHFDSQLKFGMHMLHIHGGGGASNSSATPAMDSSQFQIRVKKEMHWDPDSDSMQQQQQQNRSDSERPNMSGMPGLPHDNWLPMAGASSIPFPFSPEAAAMLSASGYLSQMPQLLAGQMSGFGATGPDGMPRPNIPPIRIFNPEAYCDLCNKEFCNKYFLKTHKANKHNIYEPSTSGSQSTATTSSSSSAAGMGDNHQSSSNSQQTQQQQLNHMSQFYMQQQQQQHHHQMQMSQQHQQQQQQMHEQHQLAMQAAAQPPVVDTTVPCDVCQRRFSNAASMRRHRAKAHESQPVAATNSLNAAADAKLEPKMETTASGKFQLPDGFREDFTVEQEDTSFTPQIRKLSPASSQLARDSNFSNDKLRRLGVINPDAFCEICCKEYCNKYFLRTHKIKRHGIYMPADDQQQQQQQQLQHHHQQPSAAAAALLSGFLAKDDASKWLQLVQNTPLNLMMGVQQELNLSGKRSNEQMAENDEDPAAGNQRTLTTPDSKRAKLAMEAANSNAVEDPTSEAAHQAAQDAISVDLQKLQSMIMQLNDLSAQRPASCSLCGKQFDNQYVLHAHMLAEHAPPGDNNNDGLQAAIKSSPPSSPAPGIPQQLHFPLSTCASNKPDFQCKQCDKEFASELALRHHLFESHGLPQYAGAATAISPPALALHHFAKKMAADVFGSGSGSGAAAGGVGPSTGVASGSSGERRPYTMTPTSSYCEICNKELCNKYFMKTHMQRMHGIEIENGAQIGGVICNICNKELCSKYFLRVHKHNTHGIVEEGSPLPVPRGSGGGSSGGASSSSSAIVDLASAESGSGMMELKSVGLTGASPAGSAAGNGSMDVKPGEVVATVMGNGQRYYANYSEVCPLCSRRFRGSKWLRSHLMSDHGKHGLEKLRELEHSAAMVKQQQQQQQQHRDSSPPTLRIPGGSAGSGFGMGDISMNLNKQSGGQRPAKLQHKHDISSLFGPSSQLEDSPMALATGGKVSKYNCNYCPFTSTSYAFLFIHERSHTLQAIEQDSESATTLAKSEASTPSGMDQHQQQLLQFPSGHSRSSSMLPFGVSFPSLTTSPPSQMVSPAATQSAEADAPPHQSSPPPRNGLATTTPPPSLQTPPLPATSPNKPLTAHAMPADTHAILNDMANSAKLPAAYALPAAQQGGANGSESPPLVMQSFLMEEQQDTEGGEQRDRQRRFVPSIVYLPVKQRFPDKLVVSFTLTPA